MNEPLKAGAREIPQDQCLPGLATFLSPERFAERIAPHLRDGAGEIRNCDITYLRYKPRTNCLVAYEIETANSKRILLYSKIYLPDDFENASYKTSHVEWAETTDITPVILFPDENAIVYCYPNDCLIDGLRIILAPKRIQRLIYNNHRGYPPSEWRISDHRLKFTTVKYKPERRAVLRCDTRAINKNSGEKRHLSFYLRIFADDRGEAVYRIQSRLYEECHGRLKVPRPITYMPERRIFAMEAIEGIPLLHRLVGGNCGDIVSAAKAIAELHACDDMGLPVRTIDSFLADMLGTAEVLTHIAPEMSEQVSDVISGLTCLSGHCGRGKLSFVHGDFYHGQVISDNGQAALIDFDRSYFGQAAADIGNFCAHLRVLGLSGILEGCRDLEGNFLDAYGDLVSEKIPEAVFKFYLAFGLFQVAVGPFRRLENCWREKTKAILEECQSVLQSL